jgi:hypothetical protein
MSLPVTVSKIHQLFITEIIYKSSEYIFYQRINISPIINDTQHYKTIFHGYISNKPKVVSFKYSVRSQAK